jgi:hypothetical protein
MLNFLFKSTPESGSAKSDIGASIQKQTNVDGWNEIIEQVEVIMNLDDSPKFLFAHVCG